MNEPWINPVNCKNTSELILCSTICVHSATRHNIQLQKQASTSKQKFNSFIDIDSQRFEVSP